MPFHITRITEISGTHHKTQHSLPPYTHRETEPSHHPHPTGNRRLQNLKKQKENQLEAHSFVKQQRHFRAEYVAQVDIHCRTCSLVPVGACASFRVPDDKGLCGQNILNKNYSCYATTQLLCQPTNLPTCVRILVFCSETSLLFTL